MSSNETYSLLFFVIVIVPWNADPSAIEDLRSEGSEKKSRLVDRIRKVLLGRRTKREQ